MITRTRCTFALALGIALATNASAQFFPPPVVGLPIAIPNGIDFRFKSGSLRVKGFIPTGGSTNLILPVIPGGAAPGMILPATYYPYPPFFPYAMPQYPFPLMGVVDQRYNLQILNPPGIAARAGYVPFPDVSGIDLDENPPAKIWGNKPALAKAAVPPRAIAKADNPAPKVQVAAAQAQAPPAPPKTQGECFLDLGVAAFKEGEYGLAIRWFRAADDAAQPPPRALFYLGQAYLAVGKYRDAAKAIRDGLDEQKRWPAFAFRPKIELYDNDVLEFNLHRDQLTDAQRANPKDADFLFLLGYWSWFDGQRDRAVDFFQQARDLAADPVAANLFLRAAKK